LYNPGIVETKHIVSSEVDLLVHLHLLVYQVTWLFLCSPV